MDRVKNYFGIFLFLFCAVLLFVLGRVTVFYELAQLRVPPKIVSDSSVKLPVLEILSKPPGLLVGKMNHDEARVIYQDQFLEVGDHGRFSVE